MWDANSWDANSWDTNSWDGCDTSAVGSLLLLMRSARQSTMTQGF